LDAGTGIRCHASPHFTEDETAIADVVVLAEAQVRPHESADKPVKSTTCSVQG